MVYSLVTLALCMLLGKYIGTCFGTLVGINADVGGVGFAILLLLFVGNSKLFPFTKRKDFIDGMNFWKKMSYICFLAVKKQKFNLASAAFFNSVESCRYYPCVIYHKAVARVKLVFYVTKVAVRKCTGIFVNCKKS